MQQSNMQQSNHIKDNGWGFYVILDVEEGYQHVYFKTYLRPRISVLQTIEEGNESYEVKEDKPSNHKINKFQIRTRIYVVCVVICLYLWIILVN